MNIRFKPEKTFNEGELRVLNDFVKALDNACDNTICGSCVFSEFCDKFENTPNEIMTLILNTLPK